MLTVHQGVLAGLIAQAAVLAVLAGTVGLSVVGALVGARLRGRWRSGCCRAPWSLGRRDDWGRPIWSRCCGPCSSEASRRWSRTPSCGPVPVGALTALAVVALVLDAVDGRVARQHRDGVGGRSALRHGGRLGPGPPPQRVRRRARSACGSSRSGRRTTSSSSPAGRCPGCAAPVPPRYWCKVVAAVQGIVLVDGGGGCRCPALVAVLALVAVAALLAESFGREVWWLWRRHRAGSGAAVEPRPSGRSMPDGAGAATGRRRRVLPTALTAARRPARLVRRSCSRSGSSASPPRASCASRSRASSSSGSPLLLPSRWIRVVAAVAGVAAGAGHGRADPRPRLPRGAAPAVQPGERLAAARARPSTCSRTRSGPGWADAAVVGAVLVVVLVPVAVTLSVIRVCRTAAHRRRHRGRHGRFARRRLAGLRGRRRPADPGRPGRLPGGGRTGRRAGPRRRAQPGGPVGVPRGAGGRRPLEHGAGGGAAHRPARQGRALRLRRELRAGRRARDRRSRRTSGHCSTPARRRWGPRGSPHAARS